MMRQIMLGAGYPGGKKRSLGPIPVTVAADHAPGLWLLRTRFPLAQVAWPLRYIHIAWQQAQPECGVDPRMSAGCGRWLDLVGWFGHGDINVNGATAGNQGGA